MNWIGLNFVSQSLFGFDLMVEGALIMALINRILFSIHKCIIFEILMFYHDLLGP